MAFSNKKKKKLKKTESLWILFENEQTDFEKR